MQTSTAIFWVNYVTILLKTRHGSTKWFYLLKLGGHPHISTPQSYCVKLIAENPPFFKGEKPSNHPGSRSKKSRHLMLATCLGRGGYLYISLKTDLFYARKSPVVFAGVVQNFLHSFWSSVKLRPKEKTRDSGMTGGWWLFYYLRRMPWLGETWIVTMVFS